ncbi:MAG TPA: Lrp/AsnC family transcriptional regulator [Acetobacteraceae bacterium]|nr:Lrp/AsnC family transcriptional regulator [Acetobacteraceae bacterium]
MDSIDRNILVALQENGAAGLAELAKVAGLSVSATAERVKRLEERGAIRGWRADLDPAAVGCPQLGFVLVTLQPGKDEAPLRRALRKMDEVLEVHGISGPWSLLVKLRAANLAAFETLVEETFRAQPAVARIETILALSTAKETAMLPVAPATEEED